MADTIRRPKTRRSCPSPRCRYCARGRQHAGLREEARAREAVKDVYETGLEGPERSEP